MQRKVSRIDIIGQNGNDGLNYEIYCGESGAQAEGGAMSRGSLFVNIYLHKRLSGARLIPRIFSGNERPMHPARRIAITWLWRTLVIRWWLANEATR